MGLNRRDILKSGLAAGAAAGATLAAGDANAVDRKPPTKWDETVDVLIVGSGYAGLAAAASATANGAKDVVVLEKMPTWGGNSIINGGGFAAWDSEAHLRQKFNRGEDSTKQHFEDTLKGGDFYNDPELVRVLVDNASSAMNWLIDNGVELKDYIGRVGGHTAYRDHNPSAGGGRGYMVILKKMADGGGAKLRTRNKVTWIWRAANDGPVLGLEVETPKGKQNIRARKAVVLASGGFGQNVEMRQSENPALTAAYNCTNQPGTTGEVIRYAKAIGADALQMCFIQLLPYAEPDKGRWDDFAFFNVAGPSFGMFVVNKKGRRFVNELDKRDVVAAAQIATGEKPTFGIFTERMIPSFGSKAKQDVERGMSQGRIVKGNTIGELAQGLGIPSATLEETTRKLVQYAKAGKDPEFGKPFTAAMMPLDEGPYYAVPMWPAVHHCSGGLRVNPRAQVLDAFLKPIARFYAAGEVTGGLHGSNRLGGNATAEGVVFGRIAGANAAAEKA
jgi:fumarate reductase flavoprotein subunit